MTVTEDISPKILFVDDEPDLQVLLRQRFRRQIKKGELSFYFALNGAEAIEVLLANPEIDFVISDINMPVMNGFEFLEIYREKFGNDVPIVVVTGADLTEKDKKFLSGEVTRILEKTPDTEGTIAGDIAKVLRNVRMG